MIRRAVQNTLLPGLLLCACGAGSIHADTGLSVTDAWIREAPPSATVHAGYLTVVNSSPDAVTITGVSSPDYGGSEIHRSWVKDGIAHMQPVDSLDVPAAGQVSLAPGGYHLMLFRPVRPLHAGNTVTLRFATSSGDCVSFNATVKRSPETTQ